MPTDGAYVHITINHFPVILLTFGAAAAIVGWIVRSRTVWLTAASTLGVGGLTVLPTMLTGDAAADTLRRAWYITRDSLHTHSEAGDAITWPLVALGVVACYQWWRLARRPAEGPGPTWLRGLVTAGAIAGAAAITWVSYLGGKVVHESPRLGQPRAGQVTPVVPPPGLNVPAPDTTGGGDDDDEHH